MGILKDELSESLICEMKGIDSRTLEKKVVYYQIVAY